MLPIFQFCTYNPTICDGHQNQQHVGDWMWAQASNHPTSN